MVQIKILNPKAVEPALDRKSRVLLGAFVLGLLATVPMWCAQARGIGRAIEAEQPKPAPTTNPCGGQR